MKKSQPLFPQPENSTASLWRYVDFARFVAMLESSSLWFSRLDQLGDPFEGSTPPAEEQFWQSQIEEYPAREAVARHNEQFFRHMVRLNRVAAFANCWHLKDYESWGMWRQYASESASIALRTTYSRLRSALPENVEIGLVRYIDYDKDIIPLNNILNYYMHKRKQFEDESEVRALVWGYEHNSETHEPFVIMDPSELGINVILVIADAIESVVMAPQSPPWLEGLAVAVLSRYGVPLKVVRSELEQEPLL